jgi:hypothetical protein
MKDTLLTTTRAKAIIISLVVLIVGIVLLAIGGALQGWRLTFGSLFAALGSFVIASVAVTLAVQQWQLSAFLEQFFAEMKVGEDLKRSGIARFWLYFQDVPWEELFDRSTSLDIVFAYAERWRDEHRHRITAMLEKGGSRLRIVLPDPDNDTVVAGLALQFQRPPAELREKIRAAQADFERIARGTKAHVEIFFVARPLVFTFYRFDGEAVLTTYRHQPGRGDVLTLLILKSGELYGWLSKEWYGLTEDAVKLGQARCIFKQDG